MTSVELIQDKDASYSTLVKEVESLYEAAHKKETTLARSITLDRAFSKYHYVCAENGFDMEDSIVIKLVEYVAEVGNRSNSVSDKVHAYQKGVKILRAVDNSDERIEYARRMLDDLRSVQERSGDTGKNVDELIEELEEIVGDEE